MSHASASLQLVNPAGLWLLPGVLQVIADLENASSMAWRTLTVKGTATLANLAHLLAHATLGRATVRTGLGAGSALESMTQLRHSFLLCKHPRAAHTDLIVDPNFRDQFTISRADDEFCTFLETVPHLFVGTASMLKARCAGYPGIHQSGCSA